MKNKKKNINELRKEGNGGIKKKKTILKNFSKKMVKMLPAPGSLENREDGRKESWNMKYDQTKRK